MRCEYQCFRLAKDIGKVVVCLGDRGEVGSSVNRCSTKAAIRLQLNRELLRATKLASLQKGCSIDESDRGCPKTRSLRQVGRGRRRD